MILDNIDVNKIITGTPSKMISSEYDKLKFDFTEDNAKTYLSNIRKVSFKDLLDNIIYVFREPHHGLSFFNDLIDNYFMCAFNQLDYIKEVFSDFIQNNINKMPEDQKKRYNDVLDNLNRLYDNSRGTRVYTNYIFNNIDNEFEYRLSDALYKAFIGEDTNLPMQVFTPSLPSKVISAYMPYVIPFIPTENRVEILDSVLSKCQVDSTYTKSQFKEYLSIVMCLNKVGSDSIYKEAISNMCVNRAYKVAINILSNVNILDELDKYATVEVTEGYHYRDKSLTILEMFNDINENADTLDGSDDNEDNEDDVHEDVMEEAAALMTAEFLMYENNDSPITGYTIEKFGDNTSFSDGYTMFLEKTNREIYYKDEWKDKKNDERISEVKGKKSSKSEEKGDRPIKTSSDDPSKPKDDIITKIKTGAMDLEQKQLALLADVGRGLDSLRQAGKAVLTIPANFVKFGKDIGKGVEDWDDERRKKEMLKPGYRKKVFATLHAIIQYGIAWNLNVLFMPVVFFIRKMSKEKNIRIRNEVVRNLTTELKVCAEKMQDASNDTDKKKKYQLMRIKEELEAELTRVKTNSSYV